MRPMTSMELCNQYAILSNPKPLFQNTLFPISLSLLLSALKIGFCKGDFNLLLGLFIPLVTSGEILCCVMIYRDQDDKSLEVHTVLCNISLFNCSIRYPKCEDGTYIFGLSNTCYDTALCAGYSCYPCYYYWCDKGIS